MNPIQESGLHEECGVFGIYGVPDAANLVYYGLHALQHRGQEGCGIVACGEDRVLRRVKGEGLVHEIFDEAKIASLPGQMAIGHVRYSTTGGSSIENVQPFLFHHNTGDFALAHNGNLVNSAQLRRYLEDRGSLFQSSSVTFSHLHSPTQVRPLSVNVTSNRERCSKKTFTTAGKLMSQNGATTTSRSASATVFAASSAHAGTFPAARSA